MRILQKTVQSFSILLLTFFFIQFFLIGCGERDNSVNVGVILPLTGGAGKYGIDAKEGIELAVSLTKPRGELAGKTIKLAIEDDQTSPSQTVSAFQKLIASIKPSAVIGGMTSTSALAAAPIAEQNGVVFLSPSASTPDLTDAGDFIFRNELSDAIGGIEQAVFARDSLDLFKVAILYINNDYGIGVKNAFTNTFKSYGGSIVCSEPFEADAQDFRFVLTKIIASKPQALFFIAYKESIPILRQLKELGAKFKLLSTPVFEDRDVLNQLGDLADGVIYVYYGGFSVDADNQLVKNFVDKFKNAYGREPGYYAALGFDAMNLLINAMENGGLSSEEIRDALYKIKDYRGVTGLTSFTKDGDVEKPVIFKDVENGQFGIWQRNNENE